MEEIAAFVGEGEVYSGIVKTYVRVQRGLEERGDGGDIHELKKVRRRGGKMFSKPIEMVKGRVCA